MKKGNNVPLTTEEIEKAYKSIKEDSKNACPFNLLDAYLNKYPKNADLLIVAAKVIMINHFYSTHLATYKSQISICSMAKIIVYLTKNNNLDTLIENGDPEAVNLIAKECKSKYNINLFSFASKYCFCHNWYVYKHDDYSIFDGVVAHSLPLYATQNLPISVNGVYAWKNHIDYNSFNKYVGDLLDAYKINVPNRRRLLDCFLWLLYR